MTTDNFSSASTHPVWVIIPAAGIGSRMQSDRPKQYLPLLGKTVLAHTVEKFLQWDKVAGIVIATKAGDPYFVQTGLNLNKRVHQIEGGKERCHSVSQGLAFVSQVQGTGDDCWVMVHDAARPCVDIEKIQALYQSCMARSGGAILASPISDTVKRIEKDKQGCVAGVVEATIDRSHLWCAHTPQMFPLNALFNALNYCESQGVLVTDEASAMEAVQEPVFIVEDRRDNIKITVAEDLPWAEWILKRQLTKS